MVSEHTQPSDDFINTSNDIEPPVEQTVETFLKFYTKNNLNQIITLCFMDISTSKPITGYSCVHTEACHWLDCYETVSQIRPCTVHITLCETNLNGRRTEHIKSANLLCVDLDKDTVETAYGSSVEARLSAILDTNPAVIVQSSNNRYHCYWSLKQPISVEHWRKYQLGLAYRFGGDLSLCNATSLIRVPGFYRITKDRELFCPFIARGNSIYAEEPYTVDHSITEVGLQSVFPGLNKDVHAGEAALAAEHKAASAWMKKLWKERLSKGLAIDSSNGNGNGNSPHSGINFEATPKLGRNVTLYMLIREYARNYMLENQVEATWEEVYRVAADINKKFKYPLYTSELVKTVRSALYRGTSSGKSWIEKTDYLSMIDAQTSGLEVEIDTVDKLATKYSKSSVKLKQGEESKESKKAIRKKRGASAEGLESNGIGYDAITDIDSRGGTDPLLTDNETILIEEHLPTLTIVNENDDAGDDAGGGTGTGSGSGSGRSSTGTSPKRGHIPHSREDAGKLLVDLIWNNGPEEAAKTLASSLSSSNHTLYATWLMNHFWNIGAVKAGGVGIYRCGTTRWGTEIYYWEKVDKEAFIALIARVVTRIAVLCRNDAVLKKKIKRLPTQAQVNNIGSACWAYTLLVKSDTVQSSNVIVFQNGVLDMDSDTFTLNAQAPLQYSHPLWCDFDIGIAGQWLISEKIRRKVAIKLHSKQLAAHAKLNKQASAGVSGEYLVPPPQKLEEVLKEVNRLWDAGEGGMDTQLRVFLSYMKQWFPNDPAAIELVLMWFGYCMTTDTGRNKFTFFYGPTRAGKGSICRTFCRILGDNNYSSSDYAALSGGFKAANFLDKLLICIEEVEGTLKDHTIRMGYLKKLLGGDRVCVERKYEHPYEATLVGKFILQSNESPKYQDKGHSLRARMIALGFERSFEDRGSSVDPADEILESPGQANALATVAALTWWLGRKNIVKCFELPCRVLEAGKEQVVNQLDMFENICVRYLCAGDRGQYVTSAALLELVHLYSEVEEVELPFTGTRIQAAIGDAIKRHIPKVYLNRHLGKHRTERGWVHVVFNKERILEDFEETLNYEIHKYRTLCDSLCFKINSDKI